MHHFFFFFFDKKKERIFIKPSFGRRKWNGMEMNGKKRIILEYSSLPLFGIFNGGNGKFILLFESLSGRE